MPFFLFIFGDIVIGIVHNSQLFRNKLSSRVCVCASASILSSFHFGVDCVVVVLCLPWLHSNHVYMHIMAVSWICVCNFVFIILSFCRIVCCLLAICLHEWNQFCRNYWFFSLSQYGNFIFHHKYTKFESHQSCMEMFRAKRTHLIYEYLYACVVCVCVYRKE